MQYAEGVLPDAVSRDPAAESWLIFCDLSGVTTPAQLETFLQAATAARDVLNAAPATVTTAFGRPLFQRLADPQLMPVGLATPPPLGTLSADQHDVLFYVFARADADVAEFLRALDAQRPLLSAIQIERGYQRRDKREAFGQPDGLRNVALASRSKVAFVGEDQPDEPVWSRGGSYLAYLKVRQNMDAWKVLDADTQASVIGRRPDGSRLDLPAASTVDGEGAFADVTTPPPSSHVRKAGPRDPNDDSVQLFRRGTPYIEATAAGQLEQGLQFVSYQASLDDFDTVLNRWMLNQTFPTVGAGVDQLFEPNRQLATLLKGGFYFAVPHDDRFIGAGLFDEATSGTSKMIVKVTVVDPSTGQPDSGANLAGATFQVTDATGTQTFASLVTNAAGRAVAGGLPQGVQLTVTQTAPPAGAAFASPASQPVTLTCRPQIVRFVSQHTAPAGQYTA